MYTFDIEKICAYGDDDRDTLTVDMNMDMWSHLAQQYYNIYGVDLGDADSEDDIREAYRLIRHEALKDDITVFEQQATSEPITEAMMIDQRDFAIHALKRCFPDSDTSDFDFIVRISPSPEDKEIFGDDLPATVMLKGQVTPPNLAG